MLEYPKIETLYDRNAKFKVDPTLLRVPEFANIRQWTITEKVDGTNTRIGWFPLTEEVLFAGRDEMSQIPVPLQRYLIATFSPALMRRVFGDKEAVLFAEGYGGNIQKGQVYRSDASVRLFDVRVGVWWLSLANVADIAAQLGLRVMPILGTLEWLPSSKADLANIIDHSQVALEDCGAEHTVPEGIVARTEPLLLRRNGERLMWKLKFKDF